MGNLNGRIERIERNIGPPPKRETDRESLLSLPPEERAKRLNAIFERIRLKEEQERLSGRPPEPKTLERALSSLDERYSDRPERRGRLKQIMVNIWDRSAQ